ncbi:MAG: hypothetical protein K2M53_08655 [Muribaculaceae bacterium]|nr:hypothetical protein [Muribaculaceae bacterium]
MTELTEKEKEMLTTGIIFSTSKPNPLFIKDGMEGGNYVCEAYQANDQLNLIIYDLNLSSSSQKIHLEGKEIERISITSWIDSDGERKTGYYTNCCWLKTNDGGNIRCNKGGWSQNFEIFGNRYAGLSLDTQAKKFFIDFLRIYLEEKEEKEKNSLEKTVSISSEGNDVSPI